MMKGDHLGELNHHLPLTPQSSVNEGPHQELPRELGFISALAIGVGTMIAAGIFTLSGIAVQQVGSGAVISFLIAVDIDTVSASHVFEAVKVCFL